MIRKHWLTFLIFLITLAVSLYIVTLPTDTLLSVVGTENIYLFMYLVALLGSITTFSSVPYPIILLGLAAGGLNPVLIGLTSALGVMTADTITWIIAGKGTALIGEKLKHSIVKIEGYVSRHPKMLTPGLIMYGVLSPLSNDFAVITFSVMRYSYLKIIPPLALGNIIYNVGIAYLGVYAYDFIVGLV